MGEDTDYKPGPKARDAGFGLGVPSFLEFVMGCILFGCGAYGWWWEKPGWGLPVLLGVICWAGAAVGFYICYRIDKAEQKELKEAGGDT